MSPVETTPRDAPLILSMPHSGTDVPEAIWRRLTERGRMLDDTDWWLDQLYDFAATLGATMVYNHTSRYVIDVNRSPDDRSLYPGRATTGLCPTVTFDGEALYAPGDEPDAEEIASRRRQWYAPYHAALAEQIARVKAEHGYALLYDCHSIRSLIPRLFDGELPVLNVGTNDGASCDPGMERAVMERLRGQERYSVVNNGRFRGGRITRHYGDPTRHVHALQMELAQRAYMPESPPYRFDGARAASIRPVLQDACRAMLAWAHY